MANSLLQKYEIKERGLSIPYIIRNKLFSNSF